MKTEHTVARRAAEKGWGEHGNREAFYNSLRFKGKFELPLDTERRLSDNSHT